MRTIEFSRISKKTKLVRGFQERSQQAFIDLRLFDPNANCHLIYSIQKCHVTNENKKKKH